MTTRAINLDPKALRLAERAYMDASNGAGYAVALNMALFAYLEATGLDAEVKRLREALGPIAEGMAHIKEPNRMAAAQAVAKNALLFRPIYN